jgi:hypothetical protein
VGGVGGQGGLGGCNVNQNGTLPPGGTTPDGGVPPGGTPPDGTTAQTQTNAVNSQVLTSLRTTFGRSPMSAAANILNANSKGKTSLNQLKLVKGL